MNLILKESESPRIKSKPLNESLDQHSVHLITNESEGFERRAKDKSQKKKFIARPTQ